MRNKMITRQQDEIFKLVSAFEDRCLAGEKVTVEAYLKEVRGKTNIDEQLLKEYLESSQLALQAGRAKRTKIPRLTIKEIAQTKAKLQGLLKEKRPARTIEPEPIGDKIQIAAFGGKRKNRK